MFAVSCKRTTLAVWKSRIKLLSILQVLTRLSLSSAMFYMESLSRNYLIPISATTCYPSPAFFHFQDLLNANYIIHSPGKGYYLQDLLLSLKFGLLLLVALTEHIISVAFHFAVILHIKRHHESLKLSWSLLLIPVHWVFTSWEKKLFCVVGHKAAKLEVRFWIYFLCLYSKVS